MTDARPTLGDYEHAAEVLTGVLSTTPLVETQALSDVLGAPVFLKLENLQRTGSFKIRGSSYLMSRLTAEERARGVVAASAGNHAQGVALAARELGIHATIFMPLGVPVPKLLATRGYGAEVILQGPTVELPLQLAAEFAKETGARLCKLFRIKFILKRHGLDRHFTAAVRAPPQKHQAHRTTPDQPFNPIRTQHLRYGHSHAIRLFTLHRCAQSGRATRLA